MAKLKESSGLRTNIGVFYGVDRAFLLVAAIIKWLSAAGEWRGRQIRRSLQRRPAPLAATLRSVLLAEVNSIVALEICWAARLRGAGWEWFSVRTATAAVILKAEGLNSFSINILLPPWR